MGEGIWASQPTNLKVRVLLGLVSLRSQPDHVGPQAIVKGRL